MLTSSTGIRVLASATTRESIPSYRPQAKTRCASPAYEAAVSWVKGVPDGVGTIKRGGLASAAPEAAVGAGAAEVELGAGAAEMGAGSVEVEDGSLEVGAGMAELGAGSAEVEVETG